eukprot:CAMPEP_0179378012 /NCGR_PEP_ID=MMETSP0797-20121207/89117_1 /TAXON_ID=47934 /ORGANISM="Dinophysis acuminata, Strain DAEP01" /LENGTH=248 /DNA_ID=CAMNT_0021094073 /DNA_START=89 /DNA_END=836 /DNA_ORIENTATION=+
MPLDQLAAQASDVFAAAGTAKRTPMAHFQPIEDSRPADAQIRQDLRQEFLRDVREIGDVAPELLEFLGGRLLAAGDPVVRIVAEHRVEVFLEHLVQAVGFFLEVFLEVLEQVLLGPTLLQVVAVDVRPLQDTAACAHLPEGVVQKLQLDDLEVVLVVQDLNLALDVLFLADCHLHAAVVIHEALKIEHVLVQQTLLLLSAFLLLDGLPLLHVLVVYVALVVPAGRGAVRRPLAEAQPAELVAAAPGLL